MPDKIRTLTPNEIHEQQEGSVRRAPGLWIDRSGDPHWSIPELLAHVGLEDTAENRALVLKDLETLLRAHGAETIIQQEPES